MSIIATLLCSLIRQVSTCCVIVIVRAFVYCDRFLLNAAEAPYYTAGRGGLDSCLMNTYDLPSRPLYTLAALTLHECSPGHALEAAIALEAPGDIPKFREDNYFPGTARVGGYIQSGWAHNWGFIAPPMKTSAD